MNYEMRLSIQHSAFSIQHSAFCILPLAAFLMMTIDHIIVFP